MTTKKSKKQSASDLASLLTIKKRKLPSRDQLTSAIVLVQDGLAALMRELESGASAAEVSESIETINNDIGELQDEFDNYTN